MQNIREGKWDIDVHVDAPGLIQIAINTIRPKLAMFSGGFIWHTEDFTVCDSTWVDLSTHSASIAYFYSQCLVAAKRTSKTMTFKTKQFTLMVVVLESQWEEFEDWTEKVEESKV